MLLSNYIIAKLSPSSRAFVDELINNSSGRQKPTCMALARTLAYQANLPNIDQENFASFYLSQTQPDLLERVYQINELAPIDIECVKAYLEKFFKFRYMNAYSGRAVFAFRKETAIVDFFGISRVLSPEDIAIIAENSELISTRVNSFRSMLEELKKDQSS